VARVVSVGRNRATGYVHLRFRDEQGGTVVGFRGLTVDEPVFEGASGRCPVRLLTSEQPAEVPEIL
jgi:hypothetical protein